MDNQLYSYSPIVDRSSLMWPNGARIAFYVGLNIEHFRVDKPSTKKDGAPVPGSPGLQAISFNTSCEIEIAQRIMQTAGQVSLGPVRRPMDLE